MVDAIEFISGVYIGILPPLMDIECGRHMCLGAYANNVQYLYIIASGHIVDCSEFLWGIYTDTVISSAHEVIGICSI